MAAPALNRLSLFAGIGMLDEACALALTALGHSSRTVCYVEREAYAAATLAARMGDQILDEAPIWSDLASFNGRAWRGVVDIFVAGFPCQPYSVAGKRSGNKDERSFGDGGGPLAHGLRILEECAAPVVFLENVGAWVAGREQYFREFGEKLSSMGYRIEAPLFIAASDIGAPHERERVFILAHRLPKLGNSSSIRRDWNPTNCKSKHKQHRLQSSGASANTELGRIEKTSSKKDNCFVANARIFPRQEAATDAPDRKDRTSSSRPSRTLADTRTRSASAKPAVGLADGRGTRSQRIVENRCTISNQWNTGRSSRTEIFPPAPNSPHWNDIIETDPHLAPAIEPGVRELASGERLVVDASRTDQLRATGNQVVALQAAAAFILLARRAGLIEI